MYSEQRRYNNNFAIAACLPLPSRCSRAQRRNDQVPPRDHHLQRAPHVLERALAWAGANPGRRGFLLIDLMEVHEHERQLRPPFRRRFDGHPDQGYMAAIAQISQDVGRFVDELRDLPGWEDTLVVVTSDHGEALAGDHPDVVVKPHGDLLYESQLRVPLILSRPGVIAARRVADPVRLLDVMPTVLEACGLAHEARRPDLHGQSLTPVLEGARPALERPWSAIETGAHEIGAPTSLGRWRGGVM